MSDPLGAPAPGEIARALDVALAQVPSDLVPEPGSIPPPRPGCSWCGRPIDRHKAASTRCCGGLDCERRRIADIAAIVERQQHERHLALIERAKAAAAQALDRAAAELGTARDALLVGVVPHQPRPVEPLPSERRAAFEAHLRAIAQEGFAAPMPEGRDALEEGAKHAAPEPGIVAAACSTCRGACCEDGGRQMAFLAVRDVGRYRLNHPAAGPEDFVARYLAFLPDASVPEACVFQSAAGCTVPRAERAGICNSFRCMGVQSMIRAWRRDPGAAAIIAHEAGEPRAIGLYDEASGWRPMRAGIPPG